MAQSTENQTISRNHSETASMRAVSLKARPGRPERRRSELEPASKLQQLVTAPDVARRLHFYPTMSNPNLSAAALNTIALTAQVDACEHYAREHDRPELGLYRVCLNAADRAWQRYAKVQDQPGAQSTFQREYARFTNRLARFKGIDTAANLINATISKVPRGSL